MNKISKRVVKIVEKYRCFKNISLAEVSYIIEQVDKLYYGFFEDIYVCNMVIVSEPTGDCQGEGQYCNQSSVGWTGDSLEGTYYFPTEDGRYLAIEYSC